MELTFQVEKQQIYRTDQAHPVADSKNYLTASFSFSEEWTGTKTAIFTGDKPYTLQLTENACVVPWEVIKAPGFWVSVYCGDRVTANRAQVYVEESGYQTGETPEPPTPDVYTQLLEAVEGAEEVAQSVRADADAGKFNGEKGEKGDPGAPATVNGQNAITLTAGEHITLEQSEGTVTISADRPEKVSQLENDEGYVKGTDYATPAKTGVVRVNSAYGIDVSSESGIISVKCASDEEIRDRSSYYKPIVPKNLDYAVRSVLPLTSDTLPATLAANTEYYLGESTALSFAFPDTGACGQYCFVKFVSGAAATVLTVTGSNYTGTLPTPAANKTYEILATWNGEQWVCSYRGY